MVNDETLDSIWREDLLNRREDADFLRLFLLNRVDERGRNGLPKSYVLNLDAPWGHGKSFFLDRLGRHLAAQGHLVAKVNAWRDDHADDPLLAVMAAVDNAVAPYTRVNRAVERTWRTVTRTGSAIVMAVAKGTVRHWIKKAVGDGLEMGMAAAGATGDETDKAIETSADAITDVIDKETECLLENFKKSQRTLLSFREHTEIFLDNLELVNLKPPLFILVDELDRCRPPFAIELLERIKHLFDTNNVIFIVATNTEQLKHSIRAIYGSDFDSQKYLYRFFDRSYTFEPAPMNKFVSHMIEMHAVDNSNINIPPSHDLESYITGAFNYFGLSLRDSIQCFDLLRTCTTVWQQRIKLELAALIPLIVAAQQGIRPELSEKFILEMNELHKVSGEGNGVWIIQMPKRSSGLSSDAYDYYSGMNAFEVFMRSSMTPLPEIIRENHTRSLDHWVKVQFLEEFETIYRATYQTNKPPFSVIRHYPELVRSAGRLLPSIT